MAQYTQEFPAVYQVYNTRSTWSNKSNSYDSSKTTFAIQSNIYIASIGSYMYFNFKNLPATEDLVIDDISIESIRCNYSTDATVEYRRYIWSPEIYSGTGTSRTQLWSTTGGFATDNESKLIKMTQWDEYETPTAETGYNTWSSSSKGENSVTQAIIDNFTTTASWREEKYYSYTTDKFYYSGPILAIQCTTNYSSDDIVEDELTPSNGAYLRDYYTSIHLTYTLPEQTVIFGKQGAGAGYGTVTVTGGISSTSSSVVTDFSHQLVFKATISSSANAYFSGWYLNNVKISDYYIYRPNPEDVYDGMEIYAQYDSGRALQRYADLYCPIIKKFFYPLSTETWTDTEKAYDTDIYTFAYGAVDASKQEDGSKFLTFFGRPTQPDLTEIVSVDACSFALRRRMRKLSGSYMDSIRGYASELRDYGEDGTYTSIWKNPRSSPLKTIEDEDRFFYGYSTVPTTIGPTWFTCDNISPKTFIYSVCDHAIDSFPLISDWFEEKTTTVEGETFNYVGPCLYSGIFKALNLLENSEEVTTEHEAEENEATNFLLDDYYTEFRISVLAKAHYVYFDVVDKTGTSVEYANIYAVSEEGGKSSGTAPSGYVESTIVGWIKLTARDVASGYAFKEWQVLKPSTGAWVTLSSVQTSYSFNTDGYWTTTAPKECHVRAVLIDQVNVTILSKDEEGTTSGETQVLQFTPGTTQTITANIDDTHAMNYWQDATTTYTASRTITVPSADTTYTAITRKKSKMVYIGDKTMYEKYSGEKDVKKVFKGTTEIELKIPH